MRRRIRRTVNELAVGRILFMLVSLTTCIMILYGVMMLASDSLSGRLKKIGVSVVQFFYGQVTASECNIFAYVSKEETSKNTVFTSIAEQVPINYYAMHQGRTITISPLQEEQENENIDWWISQDGAAETSGQEETLNNLVDQENQTVLNQGKSTEDYLNVQYKPGEVEMLPEYLDMLHNKERSVKNSAFSISSVLKNDYDIKQLLDRSYLLKNYYTVDATTSIDEKVFDIQKLLSADVSLPKDPSNPQILIYHTHSCETYIDSKEGVKADTVVGVGNYLTQMLEKRGYNVYHDTTSYDLLPNGDSNYNHSYSTAYPSVQEILKKNPSIQVTIDLHRDSGKRKICTINGKETAQVMFFNGLSRNESGPIESLENENLQSNLAFSLQAALVGRQMYPDLLSRNYLKNYRYNLHMKERSMLIEVGTANNTVLEAYNAMEPLSDILDQILSCR